MIDQPNCSKRKCKHFLGIKDAPRKTPKAGEPIVIIDGADIVYCKAFPDGIPDAIAYGDNDHSLPVKDQIGDYVYEPRDE